MSPGTPPRRDSPPATPAPPLAAGPRSSEGASTPVPERTGPVSILLVDDRPENLLALEAILEPLGEHLVRATSGEEALKEVLRRDFAVILLDVQMPGMNGFEVAQLIKSRERTRAIPIIFLTAISKEEAYVFRGYEVGAVDYMSKPFQPDILRSKVAVFVDLFRKQDQIRRQEELLRTSQRRELELRHRTELQETQARMAEVVRSALDAIIVFDESRRINLFNAAAERMFRIAAAEALGSDVGRLFPERVREEQVVRIGGSATVMNAAQGADCPDPVASAAPVPEKLVGVRGGEEFPVEASVSCLALDEGRSFTMIVRDVTERVRTEEALRTQAVSLANASAELRATNDELQRRQLELERAMNARNRFYASMSHELRTPINAIIGYNTLLLDNIYGPLNERQVQGLQRTHKAAKHLLELVNDVLDLSKIEAGKIELSLQPVSFPNLIEDLFVTVRPLADEHGAQLQLVNDGEQPRTIVTDPRRVRQVVLNLLSNAIKFGHGKPIRVEVTTGELGGACVEVVDQGAGIKEADLARIFDEFVQLDQGAHGPAAAGTGLGLPISRRLATLLGGRLEVESHLGKGSRFRLLLPPSADGKPATSRGDSPVRTAVAVDETDAATRPDSPASSAASTPAASTMPAANAQSAPRRGASEQPAAEGDPAPPGTNEPRAATGSHAGSR